ncbi:MAG: TetR family transcriptional regulator [Robiginitomaculum sp.]|nr:MAG: TetR family transcriptional regulator [Robiginitomaculum sp.]
MDSATQILEIAERRMRQGGYNTVSYRDIAAEIGIKSASLHYHFPKKENLGVALVRRYSDNFREHLAASIVTGTNGEVDPQKAIIAFIDIYHDALAEQRLVCLCAVLGAEAPGLPHPITIEVKNFFDDNIAWLTVRYEALGFKGAIDHARTTLALLEGAMIISAVNDDITIFEAAIKSIQEKFT